MAPLDESEEPQSTVTVVERPWPGELLLISFLSITACRQLQSNAVYLKSPKIYTHPLKLKITRAASKLLERLKLWLVCVAVTFEDISRSPHA